MKRAEVQDWLYNKVCDLLSTRAGFDRATLERPRIAWIVNARMSALQIVDEALYAQRLDAVPAEVQELVEHAIVPETRFFRDTAVFEHLRLWLQQLAVTSTEHIHVLSAPCSTGQEAYSIAALMMETGIAPERFTIDALDISRTALAVADQGIYSAGAFRHLSRELQRACGVLHGDQLRVHPILRERIRFTQCNLAQEDALKQIDRPARQYQLILCRNLFIYLHRQARSVLAASLAAALAPGGRLVLGSADRVAEISERFTPLQPASSFAFALNTAETGAVPVDGPVQHLAVRTSTTQCKHHPITSELQKPREPLTTAQELFGRAVADQRCGDLRRAERRCRQALYLDPEMLPALELLESLWKHDSNSRLRRALGERIERQRTRQTWETA